MLVITPKVEISRVEVKTGEKEEEEEEEEEERGENVFNV